MKRYLPHFLGVIFVMLIIVAWAVVARVSKKNQSPSVDLLTSHVAMAIDSLPTDTLVWNLWEMLPSDAGIQEPEEELGWGTRLVQHPTLTIFLPAHPSGQAVLCCPGGGYWTVCHKHEGSDMAEWFCSQGITLAVLRYRMPNTHHTIPMEDACRAMQMLRDSSFLHLTQIGVMGFSAGGHLAATLATHYPSEQLRPDFQILVYPVITMDAKVTHMGSREALLGMRPDSALVAYYSNEQHVDSLTPPAFLVLSGDDDLVPIANSLRYYQALQQAEVPAVLHMYPTHGHGWGFNPTPFHDLWIAQLSAWLQHFAE